ncbi:Uncharacterised protein [Salmonella enterica subsp. enterica serovar Typhi]|nr:Uncharacterised protein [Salmonella enterica subsp. enterica serovar Typhi]CIM78894.1 Uncharacterised protein [Salmonella enterica subsp. enterica serovar Typhi]
MLFTSHQFNLLNREKWLKTTQSLISIKFPQKKYHYKIIKKIIDIIDVLNLITPRMNKITVEPA